ncbi:unnamed protein product [Lactuca saligna]|uniref:Transcription factor DIVARICATA-like n=1 Tax=Lactuca saligna TaxID=75948 RepID=A0AA35VFF6_LACSI|nr:unnamed protein product [Lactuca saligna]
MENENNSGKYHECESLAKTTWSRYEDKLFETALVDVPENIEERWQKIADAVPGKTVEEAKVRYAELLHDLDEIESGRVELPKYPEDYDVIKESFVSSDSEFRSRKVEQRKKGTSWTEEEHRKFLEGLREYGKGDWRSISRNCVITRTPTQVASHAQKYFLRQSNSQTKERKRASIHDITTIDTTTMVVQPPQPANMYGGQGGAPPQIGYEYQNNFGFPN